MTIKPIIDWIGNTPIYHGERGDMDTQHHEACLCGAPIYYLCDGPGIRTMTVVADSDGQIRLEP